MGERMRGKGGKKGTAKCGRNVTKCERYRKRVGKPRGPSVPGCKSGARWVRRESTGGR